MIRQQFISKRFDEVVILGALAKIAFSPDAALQDEELAVLAALRRSSPSWDLPMTEVSSRLAMMDDSQLAGLVSNVKGILHEMEFVRLENEDGDSVFAGLYPDTNHRVVDVALVDDASGDTWSLQLKATEDGSSVTEWLTANPDQQILVTQELAERMDLPSSGISNQDLTMRVDDFVDRMIALEDQEGENLWDYFPTLIAASSGIIVFELWRRYRSGKLTLDQFKWLTARTLGIKVGKYGAYFAALSVPGLNFFVGCYLLGSLLINVGKAYERTPSFRPFSVFYRDRKSVAARLD